MDKLKRKYKEISEEYLKGVREKNKVLCTLITGSYFNNKLSKNSDIDIFIITQNEKKGKKGVKTVNGVKVSFFINPLMFVKKLLKEEKNSFKRPTSEIILFSDCIFGDEIAKKLKFEANKILKTKLPKMTKKEIYYYGWKLYDKLVAFDRDINKEQKEYLRNDLFWYCIDVHFRAKRTYKPHTKYILQNIKNKERKLYSHIKKHLRGDKNAIFKIVKYIEQELNFFQKDYHRPIYR